jgi:ABC-type antimicrobial peptide transport system permease subunit
VIATAPPKCVGTQILELQTSSNRSRSLTRVWSKPVARADVRLARDTRNTQTGAAAGGVLVLLLSSIGLYGAVALGVGQRRREIGVRMALGAGARQVVALFYGRGVRLGILGLVLGLPISLVAIYFFNRAVGAPGGEQVSPNIPLLGGLVALIVLVVASVATLIPATRAARVNPVTALRAE